MAEIRSDDVPEALQRQGRMKLLRHAAALTLQSVGVACLIMVVLTHICEAYRLFPSMGWGLEHSAGHYLDLSSAILGLTLLPTGFALRKLAN